MKNNNNAVVKRKTKTKIFSFITKLDKSEKNIRLKQKFPVTKREIQV